MDLFDYQKSVEAKEEGMKIAALSNEAALAYARTIATAIASNDPRKECNADRVQAALAQRGIELGPAAGSLFRGKEWEWTGEYVQSIRVNNHARLLRVWRYVGKRTFNPAVAETLEAPF